jgi:hypothetical protein
MFSVADKFLSQANAGISVQDPAFEYRQTLHIMGNAFEKRRDHDQPAFFFQLQDDEQQSAIICFVTDARIDADNRPLFECKFLYCEKSSPQLQKYLRIVTTLFKAATASGVQQVKASIPEQLVFLKQLRENVPLLDPAYLAAKRAAEPIKEFVFSFWKYPLPQSELRPPAGPSKVCAQCGRSDGSLKYCSRCKSVNYCSSECQHAHWKTHKKVCKKTAEELSEAIDDDESIVISMNTDESLKGMYTSGFNRQTGFSSSTFSNA